MAFIDETTSRADLEIAAIFECNFDLAKIEAATDSELREMIVEWIEAGDECAPGSGVMNSLPSYTPGRPADWSLIPDYMIGGLRRYIEDGIAPGHFLSALLSNDLRETFARADETNSTAVRNYVLFLHNHAPSDCWGSPARFSAWCKRGGLSERNVA